MKLINVYVYDKNEQPIPGAEVIWKVRQKGQELTLGPVTTQGFINSSAGIVIKNENELDSPYIDVTAAYNGKTHTDRISIDQGSHPIKLDVTLPATAQLPMPTTPQQQHPTLYIILAFIFGVGFLVVLLLIAVLIPEPSPFQLRVFTPILAIAVAGVATVMTGLLNVQMTLGKQLIVGATGAIAAFVIIYLVNPAILH
jgi:hypothetical protein